MARPFESWVRQEGDCLVWTGYRDRAGYGRVGGNPVPALAHRYAWERIHGPIPHGLFVLHHCDNRPCVRPDHLFLGTAADNAHDRDAKQRLARGSRHGNAVLTEEAVLEIRRIRRTQGLSHRALAERFGVARPTITDVLSGRGWGWL